MKISAILHVGRIEIGEYNTKRINDLVRDIGSPVRAMIDTLIPESKQQRKFLHGGIIPLWVALDGNDYRDQDILDHYFFRAKQEFLPEAIKVKGKIELRGRGSKGSKSLNILTEKLIDMLTEEYGLRHSSEVLNPDNFKKFRDEIFSAGRWDYFLDYAKDMKWLEKTI